MRVLIRGAFNSQTGYGNDLLGLTRAFLRMGADVYIYPTELTPPVPQYVADLLTRDLIDGAPFDLSIHHVDPGQLGQTRKYADIAIGWTMWEKSTLQELGNRSTLRMRLEQSYDLLLGYDAVTAGAFAPYCKPTKKKEGTRMAVLQGGFWPWQYVKRDWHSDKFSFCMLGDIHHRKNGMLAIQAFRELKEEYSEFAKAELSIKDVRGNIPDFLAETCPDLHLYKGIWSQERIYEFYANNHVLLAPSRGEGKNLPALEMLSTGGTCVVTNWGGHREWLSDKYAYPLDYELVPVSPKYPKCLEASASKQHLKELMLEVFRDRDAARLKGHIAAATVPDKFSWDAVVAKLINGMEAALPGRGEKLQRLAAACVPRNSLQISDAGEDICLM